MSESSHLSSANGLPDVASAPPSHGDRSELNRIAALRRWGRSDGVIGTEPARKAFLSRFEWKLTPTGCSHRRSEAYVLSV